MAFDNLISVRFTEEEVKTMDTALESLENVLVGKAISLTPEERRQYGRVAYDKERWIEKVYGYMKQYPDSVPSYINKYEHDVDMEAHRILGPHIERLNAVLQEMSDTDLLIGYDIDHNARAYYRAQGEAARENVPGAITRYEDMKQQFKVKRPGKAKSEE